MNSFNADALRTDKLPDIKVKLNESDMFTASEKSLLNCIARLKLSDIFAESDKVLVTSKKARSDTKTVSPKDF